MTERETIKHFIASAEEFCSLIECRQLLAGLPLVRECAPRLACLYSAALSLSLFPAETDSDNLIEDVFSFDQSQALFRELGEKLGMVRWYWEVFDPYEESAPGIGDLADDMADIYRELKNGLFAFTKGPANEAIWHWQNGFRSHWGDHVVDALRAMHRIVSTSLFDNLYCTD